MEKVLTCCVMDLEGLAVAEVFFFFLLFFSYCLPDVRLLCISS